MAKAERGVIIIREAQMRCEQCGQAWQFKGAYRRLRDLEDKLRKGDWIKTRKGWRCPICNEDSKKLP